MPFKLPQQADEPPYFAKVGVLHSPPLRLFQRPATWAARPVRIRIILFAARHEPAPLEEPQRRRAGPALPAVRKALRRRGAACRPLGDCRRTRKRSAAKPQPNRGTAILAVSVTGGTPVSQRRGAPGGRPEVGQADGEGWHEACPHVVIELRKV